MFEKRKDKRSSESLQRLLKGRDAYRRLVETNVKQNGLENSQEEGVQAGV